MSKKITPMLISIVLLKVFIMIMNVNNKTMTRQSKYFLRVRSSSIGEYIVDTKGMALYIFENDLPNKSKCTGECRQVWTPLSAENVTFPPDVDHRLDTSLVGLIKGTGGKYQVTYRKKPLYRFNLDKEKSDRKGHRLRDFGGLWSLLKPDGSALDMRLNTASEKIFLPDKIIFTATGQSSILVTPNIYNIKINITETNSNSGQANSDFQNNFINLNKTLSTFLGRNKFIILDKKINIIQGTFIISQMIHINSNDLKIVSDIYAKLNEIVSNNNKINFSVNFSVSDDELSNAKSLIHSKAIIDATENAEILLKSLGLALDKSNPIKTMNFELLENQSSANLAIPFLLNSILMNMKATISYNIKSK